MKKFLSFALVLAMVLSLFTGISFAAEEERVVLTIGDVNDREGYDGEDQQGFFKMIEDKINVTLKFIYLPEDTYAAVLASGDLPDIVHPKNDLSSILEAGLALNVEPYMDEYLPNMKSDLVAPTVELYKQLLTGGEGFYFFPAGIGYNGTGFSTTFNTRGWVVRWDYYKELGCPEINNEDDYLNVLIQMQANHPYTEDGLPTYLYGTDNFEGYGESFRTAKSLDTWASYLYQNNIFTNEIYDGYVDYEHGKWWACTEWLRKLYLAGADNGTFDMDLFTMTSDEFKLKRKNGQYMGLHNGNSDLNNAKKETDPDSIEGYCTIPTAPSNYYTNVYQLMGNGSQYMGFISANSKNWQKALEFYNLMYDPDIIREELLGEKGVTWDLDADGQPYMTEYGLAEMAKYRAGEESYYDTWNDLNINNTFGLRENCIHPVDGQMLNFYSASRDYAIESFNSNPDPVAKDMVEYYSQTYDNIELVTDIFYAAGGFDFRNDCGEAISSCMAGLDSDQLRIIAGAKEVLDANQADLIMCTDDAEYAALRDSVIAEIVDLGEPEVFLAYQAQWNAVAEVMVPLVQQAQEANGKTPYTPEQYNTLDFAK